jgi:ribosomal protein S18 acetylase RimI-like enzyme
MDGGLPDGYSWRRPTIADAEAILGLVVDYNTTVIGIADFTLDDVRDQLLEPGFDPAMDGWLVEDGEGLAGYGWTLTEHTGDQASVDVTSLVDGVADWLWTETLRRAARSGTDAGHAEITVDAGIYRADAAQQARAAARGFAPATTFQRLRIDFDAAPDDPPAPDGVAVRTGPGDESLRRDAHGVIERSFAEHFGFVSKSFEGWHEGIESSATHDWAQLRVAYVGGEPVAAVRSSDQFVEDEGCGYVATVAVVPEARGRGLAKMLLRQAFADHFRRGRRGTILHVDANNVTPALDLYLDVGMRPVLAIDVWRRRLTTADA